MKKGLSFVSTKNIKRFGPVLDGLVPEFGDAFCHSVLGWCGIMKDYKSYEDNNQFWKVWLVIYNGKPVGICGLYSLYENYTDELWLGWLGLVPTHRNKKLGNHLLNHVTEQAKKVGASTIKSFVDSGGRPLPFYYRYGFKMYGTVKKYLKNNPELADQFDVLNDYIIEYKL